MVLTTAFKQSLENIYMRSMLSNSSENDFRIKICCKEGLVFWEHVGSIVKPKLCFKGGSWRRWGTVWRCNWMLSCSAGQIKITNISILITLIDRDPWEKFHRAYFIETTTHFISWRSKWYIVVLIAGGEIKPSWIGEMLTLSSFGGSTFRPP